MTQSQHYNSSMCVHVHVTVCVYMHMYMCSSRCSMYSVYVFCVLMYSSEKNICVHHNMHILYMYVRVYICIIYIYIYMYVYTCTCIVLYLCFLSVPTRLGTDYQLDYMCYRCVYGVFTHFSSSLC